MCYFWKKAVKIATALTNGLRRFKLGIFVGRSAKHYFPPDAAGYPSYANAQWGLRFRHQTLMRLPQDLQPLMMKCWLCV